MPTPPRTILVIATQRESAASLISYLSRHDLNVIARGGLEAVDGVEGSEACVLLHDGFRLMDVVDAARRWIGRDAGPLLVITAEIPTVRLALGTEPPRGAVRLLPRQTFAWTVYDLLTSPSDAAQW